MHSGKRSCHGLSAVRNWGASSELALGKLRKRCIYHIVVHCEEWPTLNVCLTDVTVVQSLSCYLLWVCLCEDTAGSLVWFWFICLLK